MEALKSYQEALEKTFASLTVFSDLNWSEITKEYIASHEERPELLEFIFNFPFYLQNKSIAGDCPAYLYELAYYELAQSQILEIQHEQPNRPGIYLNPSATFLNLEYDVELMMNEAVKGEIHVYERPHVLCLYMTPKSGLNRAELDQTSLKILLELENGPQINYDFLDASNKDSYWILVQKGLILDLVKS